MLKSAIIWPPSFLFIEHVFSSIVEHVFDLYY